MTILTRDDSPSNAERWALLLGGWYLILIVFHQYIVYALIGRQDFSPAELRVDSGYLLLSLAASRLVSILAMVGLLASRWGSDIRIALRCSSLKRVSWVIALSIVMTMLANAWGLWPFAWRWEFNSNVQLVRALVDGNHALLLVLWLLIVPIGVALIEEVLFRYGLLRLLARRFRSTRIAIIGSAVAFGACHLGYPPWAPDVPHLWNSAAATVFGIAVGIITVRAHGRIAIPFAIHATVNVVGSLALLAVALRQ